MIKICDYYYKNKISKFFLTLEQLTLSLSPDNKQPRWAELCAYRGQAKAYATRKINF
jgi:hypothetical protein